MTAARAWRQNLALALGGLLAGWGMIETGYRILDPFPYYPPWEIDRDPAGMTEYDALLGWKGVPNARAWLVTQNNKVLVEHNSRGFRDVEHAPAGPEKQAVVFLGDSFGWGHEIAWERMAVNLLRPGLADYEVFNLSYTGYGTDQELLVFRQWRFEGRLKLVALLFSENDLEDNNSGFRYGAAKPKFELTDRQLVLTNVPVPRTRPPTDRASPSRRPPLALGFRDRLRSILSRSHVLHDVDFRLSRPSAAPSDTVSRNTEDIALTRRLIRVLRDEVKARGGTLLVAAIPSQKQLLSGIRYLPYQARVEKICRLFEIDYLDLGPALERSLFRTYYRRAGHWNSNGNRIAAAEIQRHLASRLSAPPSR